MNLSRDNVIALAILALLLTVSLFVAVSEATPQYVPLLSSSSAPNGSKALALWLDDVGFDVSTKTLAEFNLETFDTILMLSPSNDLTSREFDAIEAWVDAGGQLVVAGSGRAAQQVAASYKFSIRNRFPEDAAYKRQTPLLTDAITWDAVNLQPPAVFLTDDRSDYVTHIAYEGYPVIVSFAEGDGRVILSTVVRPFTNEGLKDETNAALVLDLLRTTGDGQVWFNDWHHGIRNIDFDGVLGFNQWMRRTPVGQAFLYAALLIFVVLVWQGRRFGRNIPLPNTTTRRAPIEYITAIANLNRRAGNRQAILADYTLRLKRHLGRRYRVAATLPNPEYIAQLKAAHPNIDINAVSDLLNRLNKQNVTEDQLVELAAEISEYTGQGQRN